MKKVHVPPIKSQGIKTKLVPWIGSAIPEDFDGRWIEPFVGTGVVAFNLAKSEAVLADLNPHLIRFYTAIANGDITPSIVREYLEREGASLLERGEAHYYEIRDRFNDQHSPLDFLFVNRAGFNGMIRFSKKGKFNIPFCRKPHRFAPAYVTRIVNQVRAAGEAMWGRNFTFLHQGFVDTIKSARSGDIIYCDPPYIGRHVDYFSSWSEEDELKLAELLTETPARFILSSWHHNDFRKNDYMESVWSKFNISMREHFYHVGAKERNRNPVVEALVTNFPVELADLDRKMSQYELDMI